VKENEQEGGLIAFRREPVSVPFAVALYQPVGFHFAEVISKLSEGVVVGLQAEGGQNSFVDLGRSPTAVRWDGRGVKDFHELKVWQRRTS